MDEPSHIIQFDNESDILEKKLAEINVDITELGQEIQ